MNPIALLILAFAMSTDAFAAAIGKGASLKKPQFSEAIRMGLIFGSIDAMPKCMPCGESNNNDSGIV